MKKYNKMDYINILILFVFFIMLVIFLIGSDKLYISNMDYANQHFLIPEYFRTLFYSTKDFFPSFAFNLGLGQNIYNFSYYGLSNPIIMLTYLLPALKMIDFMQIYSIISTIISIGLFYIFISKHTENKIVRFLSSFLFLLASPLIFHSHRHIMFVNYMPFLLLSLLLVEKYIKTNKKAGLILTILLIILTSYFYSIPSIIVILLYYIFLLIKNNKLNLKCTKIIPVILVSILLASFFLFPTLKAILNSRFGANDTINILSLLIPNFSFENILYNTYTLGMTSIFIMSLANSLLSKEKEYKFLSLVFLILTFFPIINYILNGLMYINGKVFIPFIPLASLLVAKLLNDIIKRKIKIKKFLMISLIISILGCLKYNLYHVYIIDFVIITIIISLTKKLNKPKLLYLILIPSLITSLTLNSNDNLMKKEIKSSQYNKEITNIIKNITSKEKNIYRITDKSIDDEVNVSNDIRNIKEYKSTMYSSLTNKNFKNFNWNIFKIENPYRNDSIYTDKDNVLYNIYVGNKYYIGTPNAIGYTKDSNVYINKSAFSIGYSTSHLMSKNDFGKLKFPYANEALLNYTIVDKDIKTNYKTNIKEIKLDKTNYKFNLKNTKKYVIKTKTNYKNKILFLKFDMKYNEKCPAKDTYIKINNIMNKLTCKGWKYHNKNTSFEYVISAPEINNLNIEVGKGKYIIENVKLYELDYGYIKNIKDTHSEFIFNKEKTKGDIIEGNINVKEKGYYSMSIPYDEGYTIYLDNKKVDYELVNTSFIGFQIEKGEHIIKIIYKSPWLKIGKILTLIGIIIFIAILIIEKGVFKNEKNISNSTLL